MLRISLIVRTTFTTGTLQQQQHLRHEHEAGLEGLGHDVRGARGLQLVELRVVLRAHEHRHVRAHARGCERRMPIAVVGSEKLMTTAFALLEARRAAAAPRRPNRRRSRDRRPGARRGRAPDRDRARCTRSPATRARAPTFWPTRPKPHRITCSRSAMPSRGRVLALDGRARRPLLAQQEARDALVVADDERAHDHRQRDRHQQRLADASAGRCASSCSTMREQRDAELTARSR